MPTLVDGATVVWDSHAICAYLSARYARRTAGQLQASSSAADQTSNDDWPAQRALLDQRLHYHHGCLFARYYACIGPVFRAGSTVAGTADQLADIGEALGFLDGFLARTGYVAAGPGLTVADVLCATTVNSIVHVLRVDLTAKWPLVAAWLERMKRELPGWAEIEEVGVARMVAMWAEKLAENEKSAKQAAGQ